MQYHLWQTFQGKVFHGTCYNKVIGSCMSGSCTSPLALRQGSLLQSMSLMETVLTTSYFPPTRWSSMAPSTVFDQIDLDPSESEYRKIDSQLSPFGIFPSRVQKVQNPYLWGCYLLTREQLKSTGVVEMSLWQVTPEWLLPNIVRDNFDWRACGHFRFGRGLVFSTDPRLARKYSNCTKGDRTVLFLVKVLVGHMCVGKSTMHIPPRGFDTSIDDTGKVFVKYMDNEYYPEYVVYHRQDKRKK